MGLQAAAREQQQQQQQEMELLKQQMAQQQQQLAQVLQLLQPAACSSADSSSSSSSSSSGIDSATSTSQPQQHLTHLYASLSEQQRGDHVGGDDANGAHTSASTDAIASTGPSSPGSVSVIQRLTERIRLEGKDMCEVKCELVKSVHDRLFRQQACDYDDGKWATAIDTDPNWPLAAEGRQVLKGLIDQ